MGDRRRMPGIAPTRSDIALPLTREADVAAEIVYVEFHHSVQQYEMGGRDSALVGLACRIDPDRDRRESVADMIRRIKSTDPRGPDPDESWAFL